jgi:hypothetical protein
MISNNDQGVNPPAVIKEWTFLSEQAQSEIKVLCTSHVEDTLISAAVSPQNSIGG